MNVTSQQGTLSTTNTRHSRVLHRAFVPDYVSVGFIVDRWDDGIDAAAANLGAALGNAGIKLQIISIDDLLAPTNSLSDLSGLIVAVHENTPDDYIRSLSERIANQRFTLFPHCGLLSCIDTSSLQQRANPMRSVEAQLLARLQQWQWIGIPQDKQSETELSSWLRAVSIQCRNHAENHHFAM